MAVVKYTMLFNYSSGTSGFPVRRVGGWSESWYDDAAFSNANRDHFLTLCQKRAALLPFNVNVVGQRYQLVDPIGPSSTGDRVFPGNATYAQDVPQMAMFSRIPGSGVPMQRPTYLRGMPDALVVAGEFQDDGAWVPLLSQFSAELQAWNFKAQDWTQPTVNIFTITTEGIVTTQAAITLNVNDRAKILATNKITGGRTGGVFRVSAVASSTVFTLSGWNKGDCEGGRVRKYAFVYPSIAGGALRPGRIVVRKVGRPTVGYRGRASRRR